MVVEQTPCSVFVLHLVLKRPGLTPWFNLPRHLPVSITGYSIAITAFNLLLGTAKAVHGGLSWYSVAAMGCWG
jgi:hypothetical protein